MILKTYLRHILHKHSDPCTCKELDESQGKIKDEFPRLCSVIHTAATAIHELTLACMGGPGRTDVISG